MTKTTTTTNLSSGQIIFKSSEKGVGTIAFGLLHIFKWVFLKKKSSLYRGSYLYVDLKNLKEGSQEMEIDYKKLKSINLLDPGCC